MDERLRAELASFGDVWPGGYLEGDPLAPLGRSSYGPLGYISVLRATYLRCIKPYVTAKTVALEIGAGRGAWTAALLAAREVWALDAKSADENRFWDHVDRHEHVRYVQVEDFSCAALPDNHFDHMFSFGCLCHVSFEGIEAYAANLFRTLRSGSNCFWLIADYEQYHRVTADLGHHSVWHAAAPPGRRYAPFRTVARLLSRFDRPPGELSPDVDDHPRPGRWFDAGTERTCEMLAAHGYEVVDSDVGTSLRDPIVHFRKP